LYLPPDTFSTIGTVLIEEFKKNVKRINLDNTLTFPIFLRTLSIMKRQYGDKVGFEFTIHFYYSHEISQSELTKQTLEAAAKTLLKFD